MEMNLTGEMLEKNADRFMKVYEVLLDKSEKRLGTMIEEIMRSVNEGHREEFDSAVSDALKKLLSGEEFTLGDDDASIETMNLINLIFAIAVYRTILNDVNPEFDFRAELQQNILGMAIIQCLLRML